MKRYRFFVHGSAKIKQPLPSVTPGLLNQAIAVAFVALLAGCINDSGQNKTSKTNDGSLLIQSRYMNRQPARIHYSRHARCRMQCRGVDENEVINTLQKGTINYKKSDIGQRECKNRYAVEAPTADGQNLRVIFAPCANETTVVTVIDLNQKKDPQNCACP